MGNLVFSQKVVPMQLKAGDFIDVALTATANMTVGAMSYVIQYPSANVKVVDVKMPEPGTLVFNPVATDGNLRIAWYSINPAQLVTNEKFGSIQIEVLVPPAPGQKIEMSIVDIPECEFGDQSAATIPGVMVLIDTPEQASVAPKLTLTEAKASQGYVSKPVVKNCGNCAKYNTETRRCLMGGFIVSKLGRCSYYA